MHVQHGPGWKAFDRIDGGVDGIVDIWKVNGSASGDGRAEYIWLPTPDGAIPVGMFRNGKLFAIHSDHLGTPRLMTNEQNQPVWQWPYSAFGNNKPTGVLKATPKPRQAMTIQPEMLKATNPTQLNLRMPGQYYDSETGAFYNYFRNYQPGVGRYTQADPAGLAGGLSRFGYANANPLSYSDPTGQWAFLATPQFWMGAAAIVTGGMIVNSQSSTIPANPPIPERVNDPDAQREHDEYKERAGQQPPPNLDACERLKWLLKREQDVVKAMQKWDAKWWPGRHTNAIQQRQRGIEKLKEKIKEVCGYECD